MATIDYEELNAPAAPMFAMLDEKEDAKVRFGEPPKPGRRGDRSPIRIQPLPARRGG